MVPDGTGVITTRVNAREGPVGPVHHHGVARRAEGRLGGPRPVARGPVDAEGGRVLARGTPSAVLQPETIAQGFGVAAHVLRHPLTNGMLIATAARP